MSMKEKIMNDEGGVLSFFYLQQISLSKLFANVIFSEKSSMSHKKMSS